MLIIFCLKNFKQFKNENYLNMKLISSKKEYNIAKIENGDCKKMQVEKIMQYKKLVI